jgi:hypothetical protein
LDEIDKIEREERNKVCEGCEILKHQLEVSNIEKMKLLDKLTEKPEPVIDQGPPIISYTKKSPILPWAVKRQMMEAEDKAKAELIRKSNKDQKIAAEEVKKHPAVITNVSKVDELEKELGIAEAGQ